MKKIHSFLVLFLVSAVILGQKREYSIGILIDNQSAKSTTLINQFKSEIEAVVGEDAVITFNTGNILVNHYDLHTAQRNYDQLLAGETDIIIAVGPVNSQIVYNQEFYPKPTILLGSVNTDLFGFAPKKKTSGVDNFTYFIETNSYKDDITTFRELTGFQKLGIAVVAPLAKFLGPESGFDKEMANLGIDYRLVPFNGASDIISNLNGLDAIYMAGGFFLTESETKQLANTFIDNKIPSFTINGRDDLALGLMATNRSEKTMDQLLRRVAVSIEAYVNGSKLSKLSTYIEKPQRLAINYNTALSVGVPLKYSLIGKTDFVGDFVNPTSEKQYNLLTAINEALTNNLSLRSMEKDVLLSKQDVKAAKSNYLPSVTASANGTYVDPDVAEVSFGRNPEFSTNGTLALEQLLFSETANANISIEKKLQEVQQEKFNARQLDLILETSNAYLTALLLKVNVRIQMQNLSLTKSNLQIAEQNFEIGQAGKSDVLRFRSELAQNMQATVEAVNQLSQGFVLLNQVLNNPPKLEIDVDDIELDESFGQYKYAEIFDLLDNPNLREPYIAFLVQEALKNSPELKSLEYNMEATDRSIRLYGLGRFLPTLALQGQYNGVFNRSGAGVDPPQGFDQLNSYYNVGLNLSVPILDRNRNTINRKKGIIQKQQLEINTENTELALSVNIRNSVLDLANQASNIQLSKVSEQAALESLDLTQGAYSNGAVNIVQLLDAQRNYLNSKLASTGANYSYLLSALRLERSIGHYFLLNTDEKNQAFKKRFFEYLNNTGK